MLSSSVEKFNEQLLSTIDDSGQWPRLRDRAEAERVFRSFLTCSDIRPITLALVKIAFALEDHGDATGGAALLAIANLAIPSLERQRTSRRVEMQSTQAERFLGDKRPARAPATSDKGRSWISVRMECKR